MLSFLNCLKHPNIVELLGSYTFKGRHYLLFPPAAGDLGQLFVGEEAPHYLQNDSDCLLALSGLASAIEKLHNYKSDALNVSLLGCHHDLKPKNVLVVEGRFLLADFGLSKFKDPSKDSKSPFGRGEGWYLAPECEDSENGFESGLIGRSSDVWSFGCIIAEVVTYMLLGAKGVQEFVKKRKVKLGGVLTTYTFHCGKTPNDGVDSWLRDLDALATPIGVNLNNLVRDLLQLEPAMRPSAMMVTSRLQELALSSRFGSVNEKYQIFAAKIGSLELLVERERFKLWGEAIGLTAVPPEQSTSLDAVRTDLTFSECINELKSIEADLTIKPQSPRTSILKLRMSNDNIFGKLPSSLLPAIERQLEQRMVETEDMSLLKEIKKTFDDSSRYRGIGTLAAIRYMHDLCTVPPINAGGALRLEGLTLQTLQQFPTFEIARLTQNGIARKGRVLIERIVYEEDWVGDLGEKMYNRVGAIAEFLSSTRDLAHLPVLECIGYYHEQKNHAFALLFDAPHFDDRRSKLFTLRSFIEDTYKTNSRPRLEDRLQLARLLAAALSEIHRVGWLHKNFSAYNVVLVSKGPAPPDSILEFPSLIGFNHSRPNGPDSISKKANTNTDELDYRHPQYLIDEERFRPEYDYFSLGMVLLEAGLWKPLRKITQAKAGRPPLSPSELVEDLLEKTVPLLDFYVGRKYRGVVEACLGGVPPSKASDHPKPATDKNLVLSQDTMFLADLWA